MESDAVQYLLTDPNGSRGEAPDFTFFDLQSGDIVSNTDSDGRSWDLAFTSTTNFENRPDGHDYTFEYMHQDNG